MMEDDRARRPKLLVARHDDVDQKVCGRLQQVPKKQKQT
jgi:hypothetical protein